MQILLPLEKPVAFFPQLARLFGDIETAIYFQQLYYWSDKGSRNDEFIYKTKEEIEEETTLTRSQQDRSRKKLELMKVLETKLLKANGTPTIHYKIDFRLVGNLLMEKQETYQSISRKLTNPITENTTENTTYIPPIPKEELPEWLDRGIWNEWVEYRKEKKQRLTPLTIKRQIAFLEENKKDYKKIINLSITNGWTGLFSLDGKKEDKKDGIPYIRINGSDYLVSQNLKTYSFNGDFINHKKEQKETIFYK